MVSISEDMDLSQQYSPELISSKPDTKQDPSPGADGKKRTDKDTKTFSQAWTHFIHTYTRGPITKGLHAVTQHAAHNPYLYVFGVILLSLSLVVAGIMTNFYVETDEDVLYTPKRSLSSHQQYWVENESGFPKFPLYFYMLVHTNGGNVVSMEGVRRLFVVVQAVETTTGFTTLCSSKESTYIDPITRNKTCQILAATRFWNNNITMFEDTVKTDQDATVQLSQQAFADGTPIDTASLIGNPTFAADGNLTFGQGFAVQIDLPNTESTKDFELEALNRLQVIRASWSAEPGNSYRLDYFSDRSFSDEFDRAMSQDVPLLPLVFIVMSVFTCVVLSKCDAVHSRAMLGFGLVVSVLLALMSGYGLLFLIGTPFTSFAQILPFIIFGVGLDGGFIIIGDFCRTDPKKDIDLRVLETVEKVGVSIFMTTLTNFVAFATGASSTIPTVAWLCLYAIPTVLLVFLYQFTFLIALIVIDERRVLSNRRDCLVCLRAPAREKPAEDTKDESSGYEAEATSAGENRNVQPATQSWTDRCASWYADRLLRPWVKIAVLFSFLALFAGEIYSTTQFTQEFKYTDTVPKDSYVTVFWDKYTEYIGRGGVTMFAYFRNVDQSDPGIQAQMKEYINDLVATPEISDPPPFFWLYDFEIYEQQHAAELQGKSFAEKMDAFLSPDGGYYTLYQADIVQGINGTIESSRVLLNMDKVDQVSVSSQIAALEEQRDVTNDQPINQGTRFGPFFCYDTFFNIWEFYSAAVFQLCMNTAEGIISVTLVSLLLIPHWTGALFVFPLVVITYVDMMGALQSAGVHINVVSYICLLMSIGLIVDFLMHVLLRYYESKELTRDAKVKDAVTSIGSSIFLGVASTLLGVLPLALASSNIVYTIFVSFIALATIGGGHGLIFLPVVLSIWGPMDMPEEDLGGEPPSSKFTLEDARAEIRTRRAERQSARDLTVEE